MGPSWVLSAPDGPHVGPMNLAIWVAAFYGGPLHPWLPRARDKNYGGRFQVITSSWLDPTTAQLLRQQMHYGWLRVLSQPQADMREVELTITFCISQQCFHFISMLVYIITWWWVLYSCRNSRHRQKSPCFDRKSSSGNYCCWTYLLQKIFRVQIAIKWSVYKLCI